MTRFDMLNLKKKLHPSYSLSRVQRVEYKVSVDLYEVAHDDELPHLDLCCL